MEKKGFKNHIVNYLGCMECGKKVRKFRIRKGQFLCYSCYRKKIHLIPTTRLNPISKYKIDDALNKVYEVKGSLNKTGEIKPYIYLPQVLIGHKFKLVLVDNIK